MTSHLRRYKDDLVLALRLHDVDGEHIGQVLAEVETHTRDTGEDPDVAFGPPRRYAAEVADALGASGSGGWWGWVRSVWTDSTWLDRLSWPVSALGGVALADGAARMGAGDAGWFGAPAWSMAAAGLLLIAAVVAWSFRGGHLAPDPVIDPRTGEDALPPLPAWRHFVLLGWPVLVVVALGVFTYLTRG